MTEVGGSKKRTIKSPHRPGLSFCYVERKLKSPPTTTFGR